MLGIIYIATNIINKKQYVGQTNKFHKRLQGHLCNKQKSYFDNALKKYGVEQFSFTKIDYPLELLDFWEEYWINEVGSLYPNGYNLMTGGSAPKHSEATKLKIRLQKLGDKNPNFGKPKSDETKKRMSESQTGKSHKRGWKHSQATRDKMSKAQQGRVVSLEARAKISRSKKGKYTGSDSHLFGTQLSDERKKAIGDFWRGKPWSVNRRLAYEKRHEQKENIDAK